MDMDSPLFRAIRESRALLRQELGVQTLQGKEVRFASSLAAFHLVDFIGSLESLQWNRAVEGIVPNVLPSYFPWGKAQREIACNSPGLRAGCTSVSLNFPVAIRLHGLLGICGWGFFIVLRERYVT